MKQLQPLRLIALVLLIGAWRPVTADAPAAVADCLDAGTQSAYLYLSRSGPNPVCIVSPLGPGINLIEVRARATPFTRVRFSIPDPPVGIVLAEGWSFPHTGDRINGVELDLTDCSETGSVLLGILTYQLTDPLYECSPWQIDPGAQVDYCTGETATAFSWGQLLASPLMECYYCPCWQCCAHLPPHGLAPADGATDVPTNALLAWSGATMGEVWISDDPTCATGQSFPFQLESTFSPDFLRPNTTYYWNVSFDVTGDGCTDGGAFFRSATQSFTTGTFTVPAETKTWGGVKARYR